MTLNEALGWLKTLRERHGELVNLRNQNSKESRRYMGAAEKEVIERPVYDVKALDKLVAQVAREIRVLDMAIKRTNAVTEVAGYEQSEAVLGELS